MILFLLSCTLQIPAQRENHVVTAGPRYVSPLNAKDDCCAELVGYRIIFDWKGERMSAVVDERICGQNPLYLEIGEDGVYRPISRQRMEM